MLPIFPLFKTLELSDRHHIEDFTKRFPPYTEFEFIDLWIYNPGDNTSISILNNNFVVKRQDYITDDFYYTFLGVHNPQDTIIKLLEVTKADSLGTKLKQVPEISVRDVSGLDGFSVIEDLNNFDYILPIDELAELKGGRYYDKRNLVNRFNRKYPDHVIRILDVSDKKIQKEIIDLFYLREKQKGRTRSEAKIEIIAVEKLFGIAKEHNISGVGIYVEDRLIGVATYHKLPGEYGGMSLEKGDITYDGVYSKLNNEAAKLLKEMGCRYLNYEQDLGVPGLRKAKTLWRPVEFLKKYTVEATQK